MSLLPFRLVGGKKNGEGGSLSGFPLGADDAAVAFHVFTANGQADAGAFVFKAAVKPVKQAKNPLQAVFVNADAVVLYGYLIERGRGGQARVGRGHVFRRR